MSIRLFEGAYHAAAYSKFRPKPPEALIKKIVSYLSEKINPPFSLAVDVGCGNGQSTSILAPYFEKVSGQDVSNDQIEEGRKLEKNSNVSYKVSAAEELDFPESSVDLLTACQAAHWFDLPKFYKAADRVLKPNGVLALYGYKLPQPVYENDTEILKDMVIDMYVNKLDGYILDGSKEVYLGNYTDPRFYEYLYDEKIYISGYFNSLLITRQDFYLNDTASYWNERRVLVDMGYKGISLPYPNGIRDESTFSHSVSSSVEELIGYIHTWSGFQNFKRQQPEKAEKAVLDFKNRIMKTLNVSTSSKDTPLKIVFPYFVLMARKPH